MNENVYEKYSKKRLNDAFEFCEGYKEYLSKAKSEREVIIETVKLAKENGFVDIKEYVDGNKKLKPGDKIYAINMDKAMILAVIGKENLEQGLNIVGSHIDSPRLDLKSTPLYEDDNICLFDTHYYGGIKKYQWTALPLALHGVVVKKDGTKINLCIGENETDPVFGISDLLPHLDTEKRNEAVTGEELNIIAGTIPDSKASKNKVKENILNILKEKGIEKDDLFSSEIEAVPAGKARDFGLDKSMIMGYGQDDRVCAYTSIKAILNTKSPNRTSICLLVDKEEIGSDGATGMKSMFFENFVADLILLASSYSDLKVRHCLKNSKMISSDVTAGYDPNRPTPFNKETDAHLGRGIAFCKYTGSKGKSGASDANPEYIAQIRQILDNNNIFYQASEMGKVEAGGGGTISKLMAIYNLDVIDAGVPVISMHAPWEITAKVDIYETYETYNAFYKFM
ncbi:MAG: aminopeptidase [Firmicutes bacterium]|nr:aminopeptidase [Bacillota bacterium]MDY3658632.1 aminopeptidase [Eubacteriales bacterium]